MSGYPSGIWSGAQDYPHHVEVLGMAPDVGKGGGALWSRLPEPLWFNSGVPPVTHDI